MFNKYYIFLVIIMLIVILYYIKPIKEGFITSNIDLSDPFGSNQTNWLIENREDPLDYNKELDNLGKLIKYRKKNVIPKKSKSSYEIDYKIITNYLNKCKGKKTFWKFAGANYDIKPVSTSKINSCKKTCSDSKWCQSYLTNPANGQCYHYRFKDNHTLGYRCSKPYYNGQWYGDIKAIANPTVKYVHIDTLVPGDMVALWNPINQRFMRVDPNGNVNSCCQHNIKLPNNWLWERFLVVDAGNNQIALWNPSNQRFIKVESSGNVGTCCTVKDPKLPGGWPSEQFKVINNLDGTISLWNPLTKRFPRMNPNGNVDSNYSDNGKLPNGWTWERWRIVRIETGKFSKRWTIVAKCCVTNIDIYNGYIYGVGNSDGAVYRCPLNSSTGWSKFSTPRFRSIKIIQGKVYGIEFGLGLFVRRDINSWYPLQNSCCITWIDFYKYIYGIGTRGNLWIYAPPEEPTRWKQITSNVNIKQFKIDPRNKKIYGVGGDGYIYEVGLKGGNWIRISNRNDGKYIDVYDNKIFNISKNDKSVWCYDLDTHQWQQMTPPTVAVTQIKIYQDYIYGIAGDLQVWKYPITPIKVKYTSLGCWKDEASRAIKSSLPGYNPANQISINQCAEKAAKAGFNVFGVQYGGECWSSKQAGKTYNKYGKATNCKDGKGGTWANNVYKLKNNKSLIYSKLDNWCKKNVANNKSITNKYPLLKGAIYARNLPGLARQGQSKPEWRCYTKEALTPDTFSFNVQNQNPNYATKPYLKNLYDKYIKE